MKYLLQLFIFVFLSLSLFSCQQDQPQLLGKWKVVDIKDEGQFQEFDMDSIAFEFLQGDSFRMTDTYGGKILGSFKMDPPYLYISTFEKDGTKKKPIEMLKFTEDSIQLLMNTNGVKRTIFLVKKR